MILRTLLLSGGAFLIDVISLDLRNYIHPRHKIKQSERDVDIL